MDNRALVKRVLYDTYMSHDTPLKIVLLAVTIVAISASIACFSTPSIFAKILGVFPLAAIIFGHYAVIRQSYGFIIEDENRKKKELWNRLSY